jgi:hypothetical protein
MTELNNILQQLQEKNPLSPFYNLNVLNYEVRSLNFVFSFFKISIFFQLKQPDVSNIPIDLSSQWTRTFDTISVNIKYHFNSSSLPDSVQFNNDTVIFYTIITDGQQIKESSPTAEW